MRYYREIQAYFIWDSYVYDYGSYSAMDHSRVLNMYTNDCLYISNLKGMVGAFKKRYLFNSMINTNIRIYKNNKLYFFQELFYLTHYLQKRASRHAI